jgi:LuxR family maltose regulon positive regulatory protein
MAAFSEPVLVETKLHAPARRPGVVSRPELLTRLVAGRARKLTLVCAPAGWGKSTLLGAWCASPEEAAVRVGAAGSGRQ